MRTKRKGGVAVRMLLLLAVALLLIGILAYKGRKRDSRMAEGTEETGEETQRETESLWKRETPGDTEEETQAESRKAERRGTDAEEGTEESTEAETSGTGQAERETYAVSVTNAEEFAGQVMASRTWLLDKYLSAYVEKKKIRASEGVILNAAVPDDQVRCTEFYVELNNKKHTLVTLRWDPYLCTVVASKCRYTKKEVEESVWAGDRAAVTDISPEQDAAVIGEQGAKDEAELEAGPGKEVVIE